MEVRPRRADKKEMSRKPMPEIETSRSELLQLYVERRFTQHQIADHFGVTIAYVRARFKREGIPARMEGGGGRRRP